MRQPKPSEPKHLTASQAGGHRRYPDSEIRALVDSLSERPVSEEEGESPGTRSA
jgi:hypothetical protein